MARVLVTGGSGFIGTHLAEALAARGDEVACLVRRTSAVQRLQRLKVGLVYGDVTDPASLREAVQGREVVYHLAGRLFSLRLGDFYKINQQGVQNLLEACAAQTSPPVVVQVSSLAAAGPARDGRPRIESDAPQPVSNYGRSKRAGEEVAQRLAGQVPVTVVRPPIVFGGGDPASFDLFRGVARFATHLVPGLAPHYFSLLHVVDLVNCLILAADRGKRLAPEGPDASGWQGYYYAADDQQPTYADLGRMIATALGRRRVLCIPVASPVVWMVGAAAEGLGQLLRRPMTLNLDKVREATAGSWTCSSARAKSELGFAVGAPLADRLRQTAQWYRDEGWL